MIELNSEVITSLLTEYGSPLYVFDEEAFIKNYRHFVNCFTSAYSNYRLSYSLKTNYAPYVCRLIKKLGGLAEVVSDFELRIAQRAGFSPDEIVYNGPSKGPLAIIHLLNGGLLNVDNIDELEKICVIAAENPERTIRIGIRVNIDIGQGFVSRFGIDERDLTQVISRVGNIENLKIIGIHCHIGRSRGLDAWKQRTCNMLRLSEKYFSEDLEYISLGSGMFGEMNPKLAIQFSNLIPTYEDYAAVTAEIFAEHYPNRLGPILFTEPGTTIVNKYLMFISTVESIKQIRGKTFIVLNGSKHNIGEICELKKLPLQVIENCGKEQFVENADLVGYTCLEHDVLYRGFSGEIGVGDYCIFDNVGGYSIVSKPPFIRPNCAVVSTTGQLIKKTETFEDILRTYE